MRPVAVAIVVAGVALSAFLAVTAGVGATGIVILAAIVAVGALALAVTRRSTGETVRPATCPSCDGLVSPHAPYCKHCGADLAA